MSDVRLISVAEAYEHYAREISPLGIEEIAVESALHRVIAEDVLSRTDLPPFPQSAMDGYALNAADTEGASAENPSRLALTGEVAANSLTAIPQISGGEAMRIFTGGYVPQGANVVLPQEDAVVDDNTLVITQPLKTGRHMREQGEEVLNNTLITESGTYATTGVLSALSIAGVDRIKVFRDPVIAILTTGDEIVKPGKRLNPGEVYDANTALITSWLRSHGYQNVSSVAVLDTLDGTMLAIEDAFKTADMILTCGGVSVGDKDFIMPAAERVGFQKIFWRVRQRPGKPLYLGKRDEKILIGIPGNPGSVFVSLSVHVLHALDLMSGHASPRPHKHYGRLSDSTSKGHQREFWMRCATRVNDQGEIWIDELPRQSSHMITNLTDCTALARIPEGNGILESGSVVEWISVEPFS